VKKAFCGFFQLRFVRIYFGQTFQIAQIANQAIWRYFRVPLSSVLKNTLLDDKRDLLKYPAAFCFQTNAI